MTSPSTVDRPALWTTMPGWGIAADLTPPELVRARRLTALRKMMAVGLVLLLLACVGGYYLADRERSATATDLVETQQRTAQLQAVGRSYSTVVAIQGSVAQIHAQVAEVMKGDVDLVGLMVVLESNLPKTMTINQEAISLTAVDVVSTTGAGTGLDASNLPRIGTVTMSGTGKALTDLSDYVDRLNTIPGLVDVLPISNTASVGKSGTQFSLTIDLTSLLLSHRFDVGGG